MPENNQFTCHIIQHDHKHICHTLDQHIIPSTQIHKDKHAHPVQYPGSQPAGEERNDLFPHFFSCPRLTVKNPFPVGQIGKQYRCDPCQNRTDHHRTSHRMGKEPVGSNIDNCCQDTEDTIGKNVSVFVP